MNKKFFIILFLFFIVLVGGYLRFSGVFTNSFAFTYDVGRDMINVGKIVYEHKLPLIGFTTGVEGVFYGPWWYYILALPFFVSGGDPQIVAGFMAMVGCITILMFYFFGRQIRDKKLGLLLAFFSGISVFLVGISGQIWNPNIAPFLVLIELILLVKIFNKPSSIIFFLLGITATLLVDTEIVFGSLLFLGVLIGVFVISKKTFFSLKSLWFLPGSFIILAPRIIFEFRHNFLMTNNLLHLLSQQKEAAGMTAESFLNKIYIFFDLYSQTMTGGSKIIAAIFIIFLLLFIFLGYKKLKGMERRIFKFSWIIVMVFVAGILFFSHDIWPHYLVGLPVYFILLTTIAFYYIYKNIKYGKIILAIVMIVAFYLQVKPFQIIADLQKPIWEGDAAVYRNQLAVVDYIYKQSAGKDFNYIAYSPAVYSYPYDYLLYWYGKKKYNYTPLKEHQKLFFVIIEPEFQRPNLLREWLEMRKKDGKIIKEQKVKGGVVVQTREH